MELNRREFLKAAGLGAIGSVLGALLPRRMIEAVAHAAGGTLTGWARTIAAGDVVRVIIEAAPAVSMVQVQLSFTQEDGGPGWLNAVVSPDDLFQRHIDFIMPYSADVRGIQVLSDSDHVPKIGIEILSYDKWTPFMPARPAMERNP